MKVQRLSTTDGFIVWDLEAADSSLGVVRLAPKVLKDGAVLLARTTTYSFAAFGLRGRGGASAAINATPEDRDAALAAFTDEVRPMAEGNWLRLWPGLGVSADDLAPLGWDEPDPALIARGALAAATAVLAHNGDDSLAGRKVAVVGSGPVADAATAAVKDAEAAPAETRFDADAEVLLVAGKAGCLDHATADVVQARVVVPLTPVPVTTRALAVLGRDDRVVVPDFIACAGPLLATYDPDGGDPVERIRATVADLAGEGTNLWLAAAMKAEENLAGWTNEKPFGRPLA